ncbi:damage-inducible protein DinB [Agrobacterium vitis]|uniref:Damage-inducible protein DinB n=1 Tax=Agrobacterium vitis TaxID=373 RepID=A0A368NU55_AGRVI|nr:DinB family protein [Agrobacterium vitis]KAA3517736.1 damage-inducible protein DinB [Agrobacterium vitis]KAA3523709.1 damage-inducible protein DinB [Agrobacterium vitis]KAA3524167.1 damage-inducible protein DinB [Agrobacterium vitis]MCF1476817.1 damage-inducible protein DinB [Agrobacterium vitis]MUZ96074.1 damage-inducible protein DinB [Agrobacterium vitis]
MHHQLSSFFRYQSWANAEFFDKLALMDRTQHEQAYDQARRLMNHNYVVAQIFAGHLVGRPHGYTSDNTDETPSLEELRKAVTTSDQWYLDYVTSITADQLLEKIAFSFTDGDKGTMTREEMLTHVVIHGGYHRGEVGRILSQASAPLPWDTFAVFLHQTEPERRHHKKLEMAT